MQGDGCVDPAGAVLDGLRHTRQVHSVRRSTHGASGARLITLDGERVVLKAWPSCSTTTANLPQAFEWMAIVRRRGVPVPEVLEHGEIAGCHYVVYQRLPGRWPERVSARLLGELLEVVDAERGAAQGVERDWLAALATALHAGDPLFELDHSALAAHPAGRALLAETERRLEACQPSELRAVDVMHGDFAAENALVDRGRLAGVLDWEYARAGDAGLDLVGILFDLEYEPRSSPRVAQELRRALRARVPGNVLGLYVAVYAARYASWAIGTATEPAVLALVGSLIAEFAS